MTPPRTASERLADHVHDLRFDDLPSDVVQQAKDLLIHHLGLALRGHDDPDGQQAVSMARFLSGSSGDATLIGEGERASLLDAVFANSLLMGHNGMDDFQLPQGVHQGVVTYPVALAFGEHGRASGRELITAVVAGYDAVAKLATPLFSWELAVPRQPYSLFAAFGSAAVAARMLALSRDETADAMAFAAHLGAGLVEAGSCMDPLEPIVARNGAMAAVLAQVGFAMTRTSIEGEHGLFRTVAGFVPEGLDACLATLGEVFEITNASPKRYAAGSGLNIVPQELTLDMLEHHGLRAADVARVDAVLPTEREQRERLMSQRLAHTTESPLWSVRFLLAAVVAGGAIDPSRYVHERDRQFNDVLDRIHLRFEPDRPVRYARIEITTVAGDRYVADGDDHVFAPVDWESWLTEGTRHLVSDDQMRRLVKVVEALEDVQDVAELTACLVPDVTPT